jgi:hypothetical protein
MNSRRPVNCYVNVQIKLQPTRETDCYTWHDSIVVTLSWMRPSRAGDPEGPGPLSQTRSSQLLLFVLLTVEAFPGASGLLCGRRSC